MFRLNGIGLPTVVIATIISQSSGVGDVTDTVFSALPATIGALAAAILTLVITLEKLGRLPGGKGERRSSGFTVEQAEQLEQIANLLGTRVGDGARERFLLMADRQEESLKVLKDIRQLLRKAG